MSYIGQSLGSYLAHFILDSFPSEEHPNFVSKKHFVTFLVLLVIHILIAIYSAIRIKDERHSKGQRPVNDTEESQDLYMRERKETCLSCFSLRYFSDVIKAVIRKRESPSLRRCLLWLIGAAALTFYGLGVQMTLLFTHVRGQVGWTASDYSLFNTIVFIVSGVALITLPIINQFSGFSLSDRAMACLGFLSRILGLALIGFAKTPSVMWIVVAAFVFNDYAVPALRSMISKVIDPEERGKIFAFVACLQSTSFFIGSYVFPAIYRNTPWFQGFAFEVAAALQLLAAMIVM